MGYEACNTFNSERGNGRYMNYHINLLKKLNSKMIKSKEQFKLDLDLYPNSPMKLEIRDIEKLYYLLYDIPIAFPKLTTISISNSTFQFNTLQYLLDNLCCLDNIELSNNNLVQCTPRSSQTGVNWPSSLKKLKVSNNNVVYVEQNGELALLPENDIHGIPMDIMLFSLKSLQYLVSFEHEKFYLQNNDDNICEFLKLNPQLENLKISHSNFNPEIFSSIKHIDKLSNLYLTCRNYEISEVDYSNIPFITTVTSLTISLSRISEISCNIIEKFPNLTDLLVQMHCSDLDKLSTLAKMLSSVKNLSIKIILNLAYSKELNIQNLDNLKGLEFILQYGTYIDDIKLNVSSCSNLKVVKFSKAKGFVYEEQPKTNPRLTDCWSVVYFPHRVTYYRIF